MQVSVKCNTLKIYMTYGLHYQLTNTSKMLSIPLLFILGL